MGEGNQFIALRSSLLDAQGAVRTDIFKPRGDIHLNALGTQITSLRIQQMLKIMLPDLVLTPVPAPVQAPPAPVSVQTPSASAKPQRTRVQAPVQDEAPAPVVVNDPVVNAPLVATVVNAPVVQHIAVVETPMEVEDEDAMLQRLFFKRFGRALPEMEREKDDVDQINFVIDLTDEKDDSNEMEVATSDVVSPVVIVKTEPIEIANVSNANSVYNESGIRVSRRLERLELAKARKAINEFGKSLRKAAVIPEKEAPLAAGTENVIADTDTNMSEDTSVNPESGNTISDDQIIADIDAAIEASQKAIDEFDE
jgi:hypothetical protein